jgi:putative peptidoglycan lipid II flippase
MLTSITFEGGEFTSKDVSVVAIMLQILAIALPFCVFNKIASAIFFSHGNTKTPMYITFFSVAINVGVSLFLMKLGFGVFGIVTGTAMSYAISCIISYIILLKWKLFEIDFEMLKFLSKILISSFFACVIMQWISLHEIFGYYAMVYKASLWLKFTYLVFITILMGVIYLIVARMFGVNILRVLFARKKIIDQPL